MSLIPDPRNLIPGRLAWRIRVTFAGKLPPKEYITPDIRHNDPGWASEIFNRPIEMLEFFLPTGHRIVMNRIVMSGMEKYNFFVEAVQSIRSRLGAEINAFWLCGKLPGKDVVDIWRIGAGKVVHDQKAWGKEWGGGPTRGWKGGLCGNAVLSTISQWR